MLIVTRKCGEGLFIGDDIRITILEVRGKQLRLGIEAPLSAVVLREEIYRRIKEENSRKQTLTCEDQKDERKRTTKTP